jgi:SAM-dependent methyltransferase
MTEVCWATPLYEFLRYCNASPLPKVILDCGAGGSDPPLGLFYRHGYSTFGIEISAEKLEESKCFCVERGMELNILCGDFRRIPFQNEAFSFVYSFNAIFFNTKPDIPYALAEFGRVLKPEGLCYVNFCSVDDPDERPFCAASTARRLLGTEHFSKHEDDEADVYFSNYDILFKQKRWIDKVHGSGRSIQVYIDYIVKKR